MKKNKTKIAAEKNTRFKSPNPSLFEEVNIRIQMPSKILQEEEFESN